jgi:hypothetical protein
MVASPSSARLGDVSRGGNPLEEAAHAITELDVARAERLLDGMAGDSNDLARERARLALYVGDCETASALLSSPSRRSTEEGSSLWDLAQGCARATVSALIEHDTELGVLVRLQVARDQPLAPIIAKVAARVRSALKRDLGVELPRPLRIDLVRDLFSLAAVTGLPLRAAETTGTVAVARWGRVTMISPRATALGYPWEDTLAHEMTHLALSRATRDHAPLWLQEGIAKREETRWREPRPHDGQPPAHEVALRALMDGRSVGIDRLGPSIAMLPTPEAASIAYAEVQSFVDFFVARQGEAALHLLLLDLKGLGDGGVDAALASTSGYSLQEWITLWKSYLLGPDMQAPQGPGSDRLPTHEARALARWVRLGDLLAERGHSGPASSFLTRAVETSDSAPIRWRASRAALMHGDVAKAKQRLGGIQDIDMVHGAWFALFGRFSKTAGEAQQGESALATGVGVDPLFDEVACEGRRREETEQTLPNHPLRRDLCLAAREIPR